MTLSTSDSNVDLGFGELISSMLEYRESELLLPESSGSLFLKSMELIEIVEPPNLGTGKMCWTVNESNMYSLISNTQSYLNPILSDANGDWNLSKPLSSGNSFLEFFSLRIPNANYYTESAHPRFGQIELKLPLRKLVGGGSIFLHPNGYVELDVKKYPLGKSSVTANIGIDLAGSGTLLHLTACALILTLESI